MYYKFVKLSNNKEHFQSPTVRGQTIIEACCAKAADPVISLYMASEQLNKEEISKIAYLSRLQLSDTETTKAANHLSDILGHFSAIQNIDTTNVPTADDVSGLKNITRSDVAIGNDLTEPKDALAAAPKLKDNHIQVPAIF